jgi:hypothetical protein
MQLSMGARCSTVNKGQHTDNQLLELREFAARQDWEIVVEYMENISGKRSDRAQLMAMFAAASRRKFDLLLFWSMDRLSREGRGGHAPIPAAALELRGGVPQPAGTVFGFNRPDEGRCDWYPGGGCCLRAPTHIRTGEGRPSAG